MDFWKRAQIGARWMRDSFASWFATSWLYIILWGVVAVAFSVLLYIDGKFSRSLAPDSVDPLSFQAMGWAYRFFAAAFLMAAARCVFKGIPGRWTFRLLGIFASVIVCLHAFGFGFEALSDRRDQAMAVREVAQIAESSNKDLIATLEARKSQIDADLTAAVEPLNAEIRQYITDGLNNDDLADDSRARRNAIQDQAAADKRAIDDQIMQLVMSGAETRTEAVNTVADAQPWHPLFVGMAQVATWSKEPSDWSIYLNAIAFVIFWVLLAESLVIFLPERIYVMHMNDAENAKDAARSEAAKKGWQTRKTAEEEEREQLKIDDGPYWSLKIIKALNNGMPKRTVKGTMRTFFSNMEPNAVKLRLTRLMDARLELPKGFYKDGRGDVKRADRAIERGFLSEDRKTYLMQEHIDYILMEGEYAPKKKAEEKPKQATNGQDHSTDLTIPELGHDDDDVDRPEA